MNDNPNGATNLYPPNPAVESLYDSYKNMVFRLGFVRTRNASDADDIVQEVFVRYMRKSPDFSGLPHEKAWFIRTALNYTSDFLRTKSRRVELSTEDIAPDSGRSDPSLAAAEGSMVTQVFALKEEQRVAIHLHYYEGYKVEEIARLTGTTVSAVKSRLMRGRQNLRLLLESENGKAEEVIFYE